VVHISGSCRYFPARHQWREYFADDGYPIPDVGVMPGKAVCDPNEDAAPMIRAAIDRAKDV
jgi:hypothetical protein